MVTAGNDLQALKSLNLVDDGSSDYKPSFFKVSQLVEFKQNEASLRNQI